MLTVSSTCRTLTSPDLNVSFVGEVMGTDLFVCLFVRAGRLKRCEQILRNFSGSATNPGKEYIM